MLCHVSVHSGAFCLRHRARDPISVAFFDRVALFSDFNHLFELLNQVLLPVAVVLLIYWNYAQKTLTACEFYEQFSCRQRMFPLQSLGVECKVCLSHTGGLRRQNLFLVIV